MATSPLDFAVLAVYLVGVVAFGLWVGRDQKGAADYMLGDRNIAWWGLLFSIVATETSTVTFLSIPGFAWSRDFTFIQLPLGYLIGRFLVVAVLLPHYFSGRVLHRLRGPAQALRGRGGPGGVVPLHRDPQPRRRPAPLPDRDRGAGDGRASACPSPSPSWA